ncbi:hydrolase [Massilia sp. CF038]|uniref:hydrolase n=1 Tax=Massilia sp. CF038 TaxID=1881045 RepID=UPI000912829F|nr:hydrolase [Massilia sp. CF038]SHG51072.1 inner membrane protein [Massilia sp. CF038]
MFVAHLPAGYLTASYLHRRFSQAGATLRLFIIASMFGAIAPDLDLFYFFLIDHRRTPHHLYWPHFPIVWIALVAASMAWFQWARRKRTVALSLIFCVSGVGHLLLDTIVGDIHWGAPFVYGPFSLFTVEAIYKPWWLNFFLHWSFGFELLLLGWAIWVSRRGGC